MINGLNPKAIEAYLKQFNLPLNPVLARLIKEHTERADVIPCIGEEAAGFIYWLVRLLNAKNVVEFGSCIGYSTIVIGEAVKANGGHLTSIEIAKNLKSLGIDIFTIQKSTGLSKEEIEKL